VKVLKRQHTSIIPDRVYSIWTYKGAVVWLCLNLVDLAESLIARAIGFGELNPFIPLDSPMLALCYKVLLAAGALMFLARIDKAHLIVWLNLGMSLIIIWNGLALLLAILI